MKDIEIQMKDIEMKEIPNEFTNTEEFLNMIKKYFNIPIKEINSFKYLLAFNPDNISYIQEFIINNEHHIMVEEMCYESKPEKVMYMRRILRKAGIDYKYLSETGMRI